MATITNTVEKVIYMALERYPGFGYGFDHMVINEEANKIIFDTSDGSNSGGYGICFSPWNPKDFEGLTSPAIEFESDPGYITYTKEGTPGQAGSRTIIEFHDTVYYGTIFFFYSSANSTLCGQVELNAGVDDKRGPKMILDGLNVSDAQGDQVTRNTYLTQTTNNVTAQNAAQYTTTELNPIGARYTVGPNISDWFATYTWPEGWTSGDLPQLDFGNFVFPRYAMLSEYQDSNPSGVPFGDPNAPSYRSNNKKYAIWKYSDPAGSSTYRVKQLKWRVQGGKGFVRNSRFPPNSGYLHGGAVFESKWYPFNDNSLSPFQSGYTDDSHVATKPFVTTSSFADGDRLVSTNGSYKRGSAYQLHSDVSGVNGRFNFCTYKCRNHLITVHCGKNRYSDHFRKICYWGYPGVVNRYSYYIFSSNSSGADWMREHYFFDMMRQMTQADAWTVYVWLNYFDGINETSIANSLEAAPGRIYPWAGGSSTEYYVLKGYACSKYHQIAVPAGNMTSQYIDNIEQNGEWSASISLGSSMTPTTNWGGYYTATLLDRNGWARRYDVSNGNYTIPFYEAFSDYALDSVVIDV